MVATYEKLLRGLRANLCDDDRKIVDLGLSVIPNRHATTATAPAAMGSPPSPHGITAEQEASSFPSPRYLGEASDIRFFHAMKQALCQSSTSGEQAEATQPHHPDSYEQDEGLQKAAVDEDQAFLPPRATADNFVQIYFSTIHIAYPFIWQPEFMRKYESFWQLESLDDLHGPWLSLLCRFVEIGRSMSLMLQVTVFAIGACYETFADSWKGKTAREKSHHNQYFDQALLISHQYEAKRSVEHICALLAQCFYLLATCQTDR